MKNKIANNESLAHRELETDPALAIPSAGRKAIEAYLAGVDMSEFISDKADAKLYGFIRKQLMDSLGEKSSTDIIFSALIERIARTAVVLQRLDKLTVSSNVPFTLMQQKGLKSDYLGIMKEHRECVEAFVNLRYSFESKPKGKTLERLRETVRIE